MPGGGYALPGLQNIPLTPALSPKGRGRKDGSVQSSLSEAAREKRRLRAVPSLRSGKGEKTAPCSPLSPKRRGRKDGSVQSSLSEAAREKDGSVQSPLFKAAKEKRRLRALSSKGPGRKDGSVQSSLPKRAREKRQLPTVPSPLWGEG